MTSPRTGVVLPLLACAAAMCALLAGCGSDPYPGEPPRTLHVYLTNEIKGLDPTQADEEIGNVCMLNLYDQLYQYKYLARPFALEPCLAAAMPEISDDQLTYTIRLRRGVRYVDDPCFPAGRGREVTASDVVFDLERLMDVRSQSPGRWILKGKVVGLDAFTEASGKDSIPRDPARAAYTAEEGYPQVAGLRALDDHTLRIRLTEPYPQLVWVLAMAYTSVYPPEAVRAYGQEFPYHAVGTGPYRLESLQPTQKLVLARNPTYRKVTYPTHGSAEDEAAGRLQDAGKRLPLNDRVVATVFRELSPMWLYFMRGYLDRAGIPKDNFGSAIDPATRELLPSMKARGIVLQKDPRQEIIYDCFNMEDPVVGAPAGAKGLAIRRAISLAVDDDWAIAHLYNNRVTKVAGPILREFAEYDPNFVNPWKRRPGESRAHVLARARKILAEAGYPGGRGVPELERSITASATDAQFFQAFQRDLRDIGLRVHAYQSTWQMLIDRVKTKKAQMWGVSWGADYPDPQNFLQLFYGPNKSPGPNGSNYDNPDFNALYVKAVRLPQGPERTRLYRQMQDIVVKDCVWNFRYRRLNYDLDQPWLHNYRYNDISPKYFAYCRVDARARAKTVRTLNRPTLWPLLVALGGFALLIGATLVMARRTTRGW